MDSPEAQPGCPSRSEIYVINPGPPPLPEVLASEHPRPFRSGLCSLFLWLYPPPSGCPDLCAGRVRNLSVPLGDDAILIKGSDSPDLRLSLVLAVTLLCPEADRSPHRGTHVCLCHVSIRFVFKVTPGMDFKLGSGLLEPVLRFCFLSKLIS